MDFREFLSSHNVFLDGGMGTMLQQSGLAPGERPELWNISRPDRVRDIHRAYFDAGCNVACMNTFGANPLSFPGGELEKVVSAAAENAKAARDACRTPGEKFIALDVGPTGRLLKPYGDLDFEDAVSLFAETVRIGVSCGADLIFIETMSDSYETKAALLAAKENSSLPVLVCNAYGEDGKLMTGATPEAMAALIEGMGADGVGANCSLGPLQLAPVAERLLACSGIPVILKPNAGLPRTVGNDTVYDVPPELFAEQVCRLMEKGVRAAGGCCGTTPGHIAALVSLAKELPVRPPEIKNSAVISSYTHAVTIGGDPVLIGERINPTGKKRLKQAFIDGDTEYILREGLSQQEKGAHILDVNAGVPGINEKEVLASTVASLQAVTDLPLQIDTSDPSAMEAALRVYNGKALINSVNGKEESMSAVFPLAKKYGGVVVALTLDGDGIPSTAEGRLEIARRIVCRAAEYGIQKKDIIFDTLAMAVSADPGAARVTLRALRLIREELGCPTSLGVSNVSFGLPARGAVNGAFFAMALENGLSAAIVNPFSPEIMKAYHSFRLLSGLDPNCAGFIRAAEDFAPETADRVPAGAGLSKSAAGTEPGEDASSLRTAVMKGLKEQSAAAASSLLSRVSPMDIVNGEIIPALDEVGKGFESGRIFLPQLLMSAEAAKSAFEKIKEFTLSHGVRSSGKGKFVIATVHGDIHDIGKNIVKLLLENYGFDVIDLGRNVPPRTVADCVAANHAPVAGLSALMTTTVPAMEETIRLIREQAPWCKIVVGGAVLNREYAARIGADMYAKDAMETVRYAEAVTGTGGKNEDPGT